LVDRPIRPREAHFTARQNNLLLRDLEQIRANLVTRDEQVVAARSAGTEVSHDRACAAATFRAA
jgi:hypothetical protein